MKPVYWNLFLVGVLIVSLSLGSSKLMEPLSMTDLADYSPVLTRKPTGQPSRQPTR